MRRRAARVPKSPSTFTRLFGSYAEFLKAAGLSNTAGQAYTAYDGVVRPIGNTFSDQQFVEALQEVRRRLGHVPRSTEYMGERTRMIAEWFEAGAPRTIPSYNAILGRYGCWNNAIVAAEMQPFGDHHPDPSAPTPHRNRATRRFSDEDIVAAARQCIDELGKGEKTSYRDYIVWRKAKYDEARAAGAPLPSIPDHHTMEVRLGGWRITRRRALGDE